MAVSNQKFYWVGSNQAMIAAGNSFPAGSTYGTGFSGPWGFNQFYRNEFPYNATGDVYWGDKNNWMVKITGSTGGSGGTAGYFDDESGDNESGEYWAVADRIPHRGDHVFFTSVMPNQSEGLTFQIPLAPCLFGGRGVSGGSGMWIGDVAGGAVTGNADAMEGLSTLKIDETYFNGGREDGKIKQFQFPNGGMSAEAGGLNVWGMRDLLAGVSGDNLTWEGISVKSDVTIVQGTYLTSPDHTTDDFTDTRTPRHIVAFNDIESDDIVMGMKEFYIYGGTCNNFYYNDYHGDYPDTFEIDGKFFDYRDQFTIDSGRAEVTLSVNDTLRVTPKIFNALVDWRDPAGGCDTIVWGPSRLVGMGNNVEAGSFRYGASTINKVEAYPANGFGYTASASTIKLMVEAAGQAGVGLQLPPNVLLKTSGLELSGPSRLVQGSTGDDRTVVSTLNMYATNVNHIPGPAIGRTIYDLGNQTHDLSGWNNSVRLASGATISTLVLKGGNLNLSYGHPGGSTWDTSAEDPGVRVDSVGRDAAGQINGAASEIDLRHPVQSNFGRFIIGDPGSSAIEDGLQFLDTRPTIKTANYQFLKVGPTPFGSTAAFSELALSQQGGAKPGGGGGFGFATP